jgi:arginase
MVGLNMSIHTILVPYDSGHRGVRMGRGPLHAREHGAIDRLRTSGYAVSESIIEDAVSFPTEIGTSFALHRALAERVSATVAAGDFPLILAGNCGSSLGTVSGVRAATPNADPGIGVIWLDAHGDFNTPDTTTSGFLDGTALATLTGQCWQALTASIPGFRPVSDADVVLVGARDLDPAEETALARSRVARVEAARMQAAGAEAALDVALAALARRVSRVYLHIDLDVLDAGIGRANAYAAPGGPSLATVLGAVDAVFDRFDVAAAALTSYDPEEDADGAIADAARRIAGRIARRLTPARR